MSKPWMGYLSSLLLFVAGILMIAGEKPVIGGIFILLSVVGLILKIYLFKGPDKKV